MECLHMTGAGNDFMIIDARGLDLDFSKMALELCAMTGADGFIATLESPMDRGAWWAIAHGVAKESDTTE